MHISIITQRHSLSGFVIYHVSDPSILEQGKLGEDFFKYTLRFKRKYVNTQKHTKMDEEFFLLLKITQIHNYTNTI